MRWLLFGLTLFATAAAAIAVIGAFLPIAHVATADADVPLSPDRVVGKADGCGSLPTLAPRRDPRRNRKPRHLA
jgi:hypothetical protein